MNLKIAVHTDVGIKKKTNQDSILVKVANTAFGTAALLAVCDGMGGLSKGELASAALVQSLNRWFISDFPALLHPDWNAARLEESLKNAVLSANKAIVAYGRANHAELGTTMVALLIAGDAYYVFNVGDSRAYLLAEGVRQITKDQTFVQREIDAGRMTEQEARADSRRNMLLQCVGVSPTVEPDFYYGRIRAGTEFLLCSDGFRHMISEEEIYAALHMRKDCSERDMEEKLAYLTELDKKRQETDNISSILARIEE